VNFSQRDSFLSKENCFQFSEKILLYSPGENIMPREKISEIRIALESKIAFQEKAIVDLNEALVDHSRTMLNLQHRLELLERAVRGITQRLEALSEAPPNEKPPHY
jgi:uncharacterized coiled-coil protein SlyX